MSILITFENQETLEFEDRFTAEVHVDTYVSAGIPVVKVRCDDTSDSIAISAYSERLNKTIQ
tara:strand:+ start:272 stop:457 length:186 start_codon:yes stop_codon:yes gene_type:complete